MPVDEAEIDAPRVDADGDDTVAEARGGLAQPVFHILEQRGEVPVEGVAEAHLPVLEAVDLFERDFPVLQPSGHHAAAAAAEVTCEVDIHKV